MKWHKKGLIYRPDGRSSWARHSALTPTPIPLGEGVLRIYAGFRDEAGVSRIGYVDVDVSKTPGVISVSRDPVLDVGTPGAFDDNGVILGDVIRVDDRLHMYYVGFQLVQKVKFLAFTGLAVSDDGGESFARSRRTPVLDRSDEGLYIRAIHSVLVENGVWKAWYATGSKWAYIDGKPYPDYHIRYIESKDGMTFGGEGKLCIDHEGNEYRIGRPRVYKQKDGYRMFYTKGTLQGDYLPGYAESPDETTWKRMDEAIGISLSVEGWDSKTLCYPSLVEYAGTTYMFYNGNDMGRDGFGCAVLENE